jgi:oligoendopeptidase F
MPTHSIPSHADIPEHYTWNAPSVFPSSEAWEAELKSITADLPMLKRFAGHLADGPATLADAFEAAETLLRRMGKVWVYAGMSLAVDTNNPAAVRMSGQAGALFAQVQASLAFMDPELLAISGHFDQGERPQDARLAPFLDTGSRPLRE